MAIKNTKNPLTATLTLSPTSSSLIPSLLALGVRDILRGSDLLHGQMRAAYQHAAFGKIASIVLGAGTTGLLGLEHLPTDHGWLGRRTEAVVVGTCREERGGDDEDLGHSHPSSL